MNTVLLVEPRRIIFIYDLLKQYQDTLGKMNYVFFCGKSSLEHWKKELNLLKYKVELYPLPVDDMKNSDEYNDFMKRKDLWIYLKGKYVLTIQIDTWINNNKNNKRNLDYFIGLNKSYIGGNFCHKWHELERESIHTSYNNFNGGLSLRNRLDMIRVIDTFPPQPTIKKSQRLETDAEDVYFTIGCIKLGLKVGDDEKSISFAIHDTEYKKDILDNFFGIHQPSNRILPYLKKEILSTFFYLKSIAIFNGFSFHYEMFGYIIEYCSIRKIKLDIYTETKDNMGWLDFYLKEFPNMFTLFNISAYNPDNNYLKVILLTDDDPSFDKSWTRDNTVSIDHYHLNRSEYIKTHIGTRYFSIRPTLDWILPVYRQMDINTKKKIGKNNIVFIGGTAREMINSEFVKNLNINCIFIDRFIENCNLNTEEMIEILKVSNYVFVSYHNNDHLEGKIMSASIPLALNFLCTLIIPKKMNESYKLKSVIEYDEKLLLDIKFKHDPKRVNKDLSWLLKHKMDTFDRILI